MKRWIGRGMAGAALLELSVLTEHALAQIGGGSSRVPLTDWIIELYSVTDNVYVPMLCLGAVAFAAANLLFGFMRFGPAVGRVVGVIGIAGLGVTWFAQTIGARLAVALLG